jgi:hypothetical protein
MSDNLLKDSLSENLLARYVELNNRSKEIKDEMDKIKHVFHLFFDEKNGPLSKAEVRIGDYFVQRQIRVIEGYDDEKAVEKLEALNLKDCIKYVKKPDEQKIDAAIHLGLLSSQDLSPYKKCKTTQAISVKRVK